MVYELIHVKLYNFYTRVSVNTYRHCYPCILITVLYFNVQIIVFFLIYPSTSNEYRQKIHAIIKMLADYQKLFTYLRMQTSDI